MTRKMVVCRDRCCITDRDGIVLCHWQNGGGGGKTVLRYRSGRNDDAHRSGSLSAGISGEEIGSVCFIGAGTGSGIQRRTFFDGQSAVCAGDEGSTGGKKANENIGRTGQSGV